MQTRNEKIEFICRLKEGMDGKYDGWERLADAEVYWLNHKCSCIVSAQDNSESIWYMCIRGESGTKLKRIDLIDNINKKNDISFEFYSLEVAKDRNITSLKFINTKRKTDMTIHIQ